LILTNGNNTYTGGTTVNGGSLILVKGGGTSTIVGTLNINPGGTVNLNAGDALGYNAGVSITPVNIAGGTLNNSGGNQGFISTFNLTGGTMAGVGAYNFNGASSAINTLATNVVSTISANVAMRANGLTITTAQGTVPGGIDLSITGAITDNGGNTLDKEGNGTLSLSGVNTFNGDITIGGGSLRIDGAGRLNSGNYTAQIHNNGTLFSYNSSAAQSLGVVSGTGPLTQNGPGTLTLNSVNTYTGQTTVNGGALAGNGTITSAVTVNSGGTLAPGSAGVGTLTISSNLTLHAGSTSSFTVNGTTPANTAVAVSGTVTYSGVLNVLPAGAFSNGQKFTLFSGAGTTNGSNFSSILGAPNGFAFTFTNGVLSVLSTGPSGSNHLTNSVTGSSLSLSWGPGWKLQMQTNNLSTGLRANWVYVTDGTATSTNITINPNQPTAFYRLVYP
jgi:fibronectin-binding autotransporter adhesin